MVPGQVVDRHRGDLSLLGVGDGLGGAAEFRGRARPDFDEDDRPVVFGNDVDFAMPRAVAAIKNCVPAGGQFRNREILACFTEELSLARHGAPASQDARRRQPQ